ncbi:MAG TPA: GNAT family N-acetyltransferase [Rhizomicrobium sp.]
MEIRTARRTDLPALKELLRRSWLTTWAPHLRPATVHHFHEIDSAGNYAESCWRQFGVAEEDGGLRGMFHIEGDHLNAIHLDPDRKRRGIGSRLMDEIERRIGASHQQACLEVLAFNTGAIAFYTSRGWTRQRTYQTLECGEPVETFEMIKRLRP